MTIHKAAFSIVLSALVAVTLAPFAAHAAPVLIDRIEASVNSGLILNSDIAHFRRTERLRAQLDPLYAGTSIGAKGANASDSEIVSYRTAEKLITQQFPVSDAEVEQEINSIQSNNKIDRSKLRSALAEQGFTFDDYFELLRSSTAKRNLIDRDIRTRVSISDADIKNYYFNKLSKGDASNRAYQLRIIYLSPKTYKTQAALGDAARRAQDAIKGGETFEEVAKRMSDDATASSGGDLGTVTDDQMNPAVREQVKKLRIGQVSEIFGAPAQGYYLVKLVDVKSDETNRLDRMKEEIRGQLMASEYQHQIQIWLERQRQNAFIHRAEPSNK